MARSAPVILDDDDPRPRRSAEPMETNRTGFEWGLASTIIGATFLLAAPIAMLSWFVLLDRSRSNSSYSSTNWMEVSAVIGVIGAVVLCMIGFIFSLRGIRYARQSKQTIAMPLTGMFLCLTGLITWALVSLVLLMVLEEQTRWTGQ